MAHGGKRIAHRSILVHRVNRLVHGENNIVHGCILAWRESVLAHQEKICEMGGFVKLLCFAVMVFMDLSNMIVDITCFDLRYFKLCIDINVLV